MTDRAKAMATLMPMMRRVAIGLAGRDRSEQLLDRALEPMLSTGPLAPVDRLKLLMLAHLVRVTLLDEPDRPVALDRVLLVLSDIASLSAAEIAEICGLKAPDVLRRVNQARAAIRARRGLRARLLIIEDEPMTALSMAQTLSRAGHRVVGIAGSEREAVMFARQHDIDLLVADVRLRNGDDGIAVVSRIRRARPVPAVFVAGEPRLAAERVSGEQVVAKPFVPSALQGAVQRALAERKGDGAEPGARERGH